jgi:hypothetical protein
MSVIDPKRTSEHAGLQPGFTPLFGEKTQITHQIQINYRDFKVPVAAKCRKVRTRISTAGRIILGKEGHDSLKGPKPP